MANYHKDLFIVHVLDSLTKKVLLAVGQSASYSLGESQGSQWIQAAHGGFGGAPSLQ